MATFLFGALSVLVVQAIGVGIMLFVFCDDKERWRPAPPARISRAHAAGALTEYLDMR
jgi:hypothetical protein